MKTVLSLIKINLISSYLPSSKSKLSKSKLIWTLIGISLLMIYISVILYFVMGGLLDILLVVNQPGILILLFLVISTALALFFGIISAPGTLYFANDTERLLVLPIKSWQIIVSKYMSNLIATWLSGLVLIIPFTIVYMTKVSVPWFFPILVIIGAMIVEILPYTLAILITIIIFSIIPANKFKNLFMYFGLFLSLFISIGITQLIIPMTEQALDSPMFMLSLLSGNNSILNSIGTILPTINWITKGIVNIDLFLLLLAAVISIGITAIVILMLQHLYFKGIQKIGENSASSKKMNQKTFNKNVKQRSLIAVLMSFDFKTILRTPILATNYLVTLIVVPIIVFVSMFSSLNKDNLLTYLPEINQMIATVPTEVRFSVVILLSILAGIFLGSMSTMASTSFSREGQQMSVFLSKPVSLISLIYAKLLLAIIVSSVPLIFIPWILNLYIPLSLLEFILMYICMFIGVGFISLVGISLDILKPKLNWDTLQQAIKGNFMTVIPILLAIGLSSLLGFVIFYSLEQSISILVPTYIILGSLILLDFGFIWFISAKGTTILTNNIYKKL